TLQALAQGRSSKRTGAPGGVTPPGAAGGPVSADLFSGQVKITADKNTNSLVVIASQADYRNLVKVVEQLDIRRRQVFVEAVIMEVNLDNETDLGVSAHGGTVIDNVSFRGTKGPAPLVLGSELGGLGSSYPTIQGQKVQLRLRIKPQINESDYVRLEVDEQTEEIASNDKQLGPTTSKRTAKTTVVAKDQETVVLGGLIQERTIRDVKKLPVLGSLPVIGWLFRNETTKKTKT